MVEETSSLFKSLLFRPLGRFDQTAYLGLTEAGRPLYETWRGEEKALLVTAFFLRAEEAEIWKAFCDMLDHALKAAAASLLGFYGFRLLACELSSGLKHFDWGRMPELLLNHGRAMAVGETRLIQFGSLFGLFHKRMPESWGKIERKYSVDIFRKEPAQLDLYFKQLLRDALPKAVPGQKLTLAAFDLSTRPVLDPQNAEQAARLGRLAASGAGAELILIHAGESYSIQPHTDKSKPLGNGGCE